MFSLSLLQFLYSSVMMNDLPGVLCAIAHGANTNFVNKNDESKSPILLAVEAVSIKNGYCKYVN